VKRSANLQRNKKNCCSDYEPKDKEGTDGAVILGTTGEGSMINIDERTEVIKTAVKTVKGAMPIIIGTGTIETHKVIELTNYFSLLELYYLLDGYFCMLIQL
jgi:dihydrodipicolinate synthase/N-acetylneuraminate lyase